MGDNRSGQPPGGFPSRACAADFAGRESGSHEPLRLTVMRYNIHHCEGTDKKLDVARIAAVINAAKPDLVALQEVDRNTNRTNHVDQPAELAKLTKMHVFFGKAMDFEGGEY